MTRIEKEFKELIIEHSELDKLKRLETGWEITGMLAVTDGNGYCWDHYNVCIVIANDYPSSLPILKEVDGKIERHIDWHINYEGICCVGTVAQQFNELKDGISLVNWVRRFAVPYLANHVLRMKKGSYANGVYSHGIRGILEYYQELFQLSKPAEILKRINQLRGNIIMSKNELCFCGSRKKYKRCFVLNEAVHRMNIPLKVLIGDALLIEKWLKDRLC